MRRFSWFNVQTIVAVEDELNKNGVVLAEGDTVMGLLVNASEQGFARLNQIKKRVEKPYLVLVHDDKKAIDLITVSAERKIQIEKLMKVCWPGPVTLIFKAKADLPFYMKAIDGTIAIRVPDHQGLLKLLEKCDALFSTSANSSGNPVPKAFDDVEKSIIDSVACVVVNGESDKAQSVLPSTIIDCTEERVVVVRQGAFDVSRLKQFF